MEPQQTMYEPPAPPPPSPEIPPSTGKQKLDKEGLRALITGAIITAFVVIFPFLSFIFRYVITLVHEFGHAIFGWIFGYPSLPAFDFMYGGGVTMHQDQKFIIVILIFGIMGWILYALRRNFLSMFLAGLIFGFYALAVFTSLHHLIILFMGHGTELFFGGLFLYRALSGSAVIHSAERPLYAFLGLFTFFIVTRFAYRLMTSSAFRAMYGDAKGGGHWMDFSRIANEFLNMELPSVARLFFIICLLSPILTYLFFINKPGLTAAFKRRLLAD